MPGKEWGVSSARKKDDLGAGSRLAPPASRTIMIMAGGTGGHIFPALSVADYLKAEGWNVVWLGARGGMEAQVVPPRGYTMAWIRFSGVRGKGFLPIALLPIYLLVAFWQSARAIFLHRPDVMLGMGGYTAFPAGMMGAFFNRPLVIHEQNSVAGLSNRVLAKVADRILVAFPDAFGKSTAAIWTGNPVRTEIAGLGSPEARYAGRSGRLKLLVIGGSRGAQVLNDVVPQALALMPENTRPSVTHQSGVAHLEALRTNYRKVGVEAELVPLIDDMAACYAAADLVVCRAGATTIAELAAVGVGAVLIPYPHAVDDHQTRNARFLSERDAAVLIPQHEFTADKLAGLLGEFTRERLLTMAKSARAAGKRDATRAVAEVCMELARAA